MFYKNKYITSIKFSNKVWTYLTGGNKNTCSNGRDYCDCDIVFEKCNSLVYHHGAWVKHIFRKPALPFTPNIFINDRSSQKSRTISSENPLGVKDLLTIIKFTFILLKKVSLWELYYKGSDFLKSINNIFRRKVYGIADVKREII